MCVWQISFSWDMLWISVQVNSFTRYNKLPPINSEAKKSEKIEITNDSCAETTSLRRSVTNLHSWLQGFDAMNRAMLSQCDADGLLSSSELARILNNFDLVYNMSLPKGLVVELIEKLESPAFTIDAHEFCSQFLKQLQQNNPALSEKNTSIWPVYYCWIVFSPASVQNWAGLNFVDNQSDPLLLKITA